MNGGQVGPEEFTMLGEALKMAGDKGRKLALDARYETGPVDLAAVASWLGLRIVSGDDPSPDALCVPCAGNPEEMPRAIARALVGAVYQVPADLAAHRDALLDGGMEALLAEEEPWRDCIHEAGHAAVCIAFGVPFVSVGVGFGTCAVWWDPSRGQGIPGFCAMLAMAGRVAESMEWGLPVSICGDDAPQALAYAREAGATDEEGYRQSAIRAARTVLEEVWAHVADIAEALRERPLWTSDEIAERLRLARR